MDQHKTKKEWVTPKLTVLVRGRPEESVLAGCKHPSLGYGPDRPNCKEPGGVECSIQFPS